MSMRRVVINVALCYVAMKPNGQKNDVRCEQGVEPFKVSLRFRFKKFYF